MLFVDDMFVASQSMIEISKLKTQLDMTFQMKDRGATKQILGIEVYRDRNNGKMWLSQQKSMEKIPMRFSMNIVKPVDILLAFHCKFSSSLCLGYEEEKVLSSIPYVNTVRSMYAMK